MLEKNEKDKYRHYKGGVYYKLAEAIITDRVDEFHPNVEIIGEATFEETCEPMLILSNKATNKVFVCFRDRDSDAATEFIEKVIIYQSEKDDKICVRLKEVFDGYVFNDINDQSIKRFAKID